MDGCEHRVDAQIPCKSTSALTAEPFFQLPKIVLTAGIIGVYYHVWIRNIFIAFSFSIPLPNTAGNKRLRKRKSSNLEIMFFTQCCPASSPNPTRAFIPKPLEMHWLRGVYLG